MKKKSLTISGHATSISLEQEFWDALQSIAAQQNRTITSLVREVDATRQPGTNLSSALRVFTLKFYSTEVIDL